MREEDVILHGPEGFEGMRKAGQLAADVLDMIIAFVMTILPPKARCRHL